MSKRQTQTTFKRRAKDFYATTDRAVIPPLTAHLEPGAHFVEPCAGAGDLIGLLEARGLICVGACDIKPKASWIKRVDILSPRTGKAFQDAVPDDAIYITNPPWRRDWLHPLIVTLSDHRPTWLLFDSDWAYTDQAKPFENRLRKVVTVGRVKWIPGSKSKGYDNCSWYLFDKPGGNEAATFHMREAAA